MKSARILVSQDVRRGDRDAHFRSWGMLRWAIAFA
jgi:hypothetical protein